MHYLTNTWIRVIISLLGGGMLAELIHISTGDPNRPMTMNLSWLYALVVYAMLTWLVKKSGRQP